MHSKQLCPRMHPQLTLLKAMHAAATCKVPVLSSSLLTRTSAAHLRRSDSCCAAALTAPMLPSSACEACWPAGCIAEAPCLMGLLLGESLHLLNVLAIAELPLGQTVAAAAPAAATAALPGDLLPAASFTSPRLLLRFMKDAALACRKVTVTHWFC